MSESVWYELRLPPDADLRRVYDWADSAGVSRIHHFRWEPWHPGGIVLRMETTLSPERMVDWADGVAVSKWDASKDEKLFGDNWLDVADLFEVWSRLSIAEWDDGRRWALEKLIHCQLNAWGLDVLPEARWASWFARRRIRAWWRYDSRLRKRLRGCRG